MTVVAISARSFREAEGTHHDLLRSSGLKPRYPSQTSVLSEHEMVDLVSGCAGLIVGLDPVTGPVLDAGPLLSVVKYGSGLDNVDIDAAQARGVDVRATAGANARSVAELTIGLLLAVARGITVHDRAVRGGRSLRRIGTELTGKRLGVIGYGAVGREVAKIARGLGMDVVAHDPYLFESDLPLLALDELLTTSRAITVHVPLSDSTRRMISSRELSLLEPGAFVVNTARDELIDMPALTEALESGRLGGAASDCVGPDTAVAKLIKHDNFVASPHAGAATREAIERTGVAAVRELLESLARRVT